MEILLLLGVGGYCLLVWDIQRKSRRRSPSCQGRVQCPPAQTPAAWPRREVKRSPTQHEVRRRPEQPPADPLIGMLQSLGFKRSEAVSWAAHVQGSTPEGRIADVLRQHGDHLLAHRKIKAGMPTVATLTALSRHGCEKTAREVAREQGIDADALEEELAQIRAYAEAAEGLGTGALICDSETGEVKDRIGSGLPGWLQDRGGAKEILAALNRRSGKLYDDLVMLAVEQRRNPVPF